MKKRKKTIKTAIITIIVLTLFNIINTYQNEITSSLNKTKIEKEYASVSKEVPNLEITFLDVGQADSTLIRYKDKNVLIDAGNNDDGELLVDYFKNIGINNFQYVVGTHAHEDHIGGIDDIIDNFDIEHYLMPKAKQNSKTYNDVIESLENKNMKQETPKIDDTFYVDDLKFDVLSVRDKAEDLNDTSIVLKLTYKENKFLFMADATKDVELSILDKDIKSDVLKAGHHGSKYSSSAQFIVKVKPKYVIISAGENNKYNHPHQVTLDKFEYIKSTIFQTQKDKSIKIISDGENLEVEKIQTNTNKK